MNSKLLTFLIFGMVLLLVGAYAAFLLWQIMPAGHQSLESASAFGDSFGVVNSLFSGLAFGGLLVTILLQRNDLALQREELKSTRKEMENQGRVQERQAFENTFFHLLKHQNDLLKDIDLTQTASSGISVTNGRDCLSVFVRRLKKNFDESRSSHQGKQLTLTAFQKFWASHSQELSHFFGNFCSILGFIDAGERPFPHVYTHILRGQLSNQEMVLLFYYSLFQAEHENKNYLKKLIESHGIFGEMDASLLFDADHIRYFDEQAYGFGYTNSRS